MNLNDPNIKLLISKEGVSGLGLYSIIRDELIKRTKMTLSDILAFADIYAYPDMIVRIVTMYDLFMTSDNATFYPFGKRLNEFTVDDAFALFDMSTLRGRFFSKLKTVHSITDEKISVEFTKWKERNAGVNFKDERHLENSFSYWLSTNVKDKEFKKAVDWSAI
jgi:hypothetical protein